MNPIHLAMVAAREAGSIILNSYGKIRSTQIVVKEKFDYMTTVDKASEQIIVDMIRTHFPDHAILAEESGATPQSRNYRWIIDPLDGTTNYIHGFPFCSVSIALEYQKEIILGVVYDPLRNELFHAEKGQGAFLNNQKIRVSSEQSMSQCLIGTGFPFKNKNLVPKFLEMFAAVFQHVSGIRRAGSAALDLSYVACGRFDGFWEMRLSPWDIAAGVVLVREAGGVFSDLTGDENHFLPKDILATNMHIYETMLKTLKPIYNSIE
jgi:myo-inositol-1(or 4)-monophosphatase